VRPKLSENPRDWLKFTAAICIVLVLVILGLARRGVIHGDPMWLLLALPAGLFLLCLVKPRWFRGFYRAGMTLSFFVGQSVSRILLTLLFILIVTPLGLFLRLLGKDLLRLRRNSSTPSYWHPASRPQNLDRQF
jgi:hypothetical protein